jgi:hypothetical protein
VRWNPLALPGYSPRPRSRPRDEATAMARDGSLSLSLFLSLIPLCYGGGREGRKRGGRGEPGVMAPYMDANVARARQ